MTPAANQVTKHQKYPALLLNIALLAGFCTMSYEVLWFRVLKYFVDNSIHSFAIMLTTFLFGLTVGAYLFSRFIDARKDAFFFLGFIEMGIGLFCLLSVPVISHGNSLIPFFNNVLGTGWNSEVIIRFLVFSIIMVPPTALMGGAFPIIIRLYSANTAGVGKSLGEVYGINTVGGVLGSFAGGFVLIPLFGVQNSIFAVSLINISIGFACLFSGSLVRKKTAGIISGICAAAIVVLFFIVPRNAFTPIYSAKYPSPKNTLLYLKENINGTTAVFKDAASARMKYFLIDGTGEVSTDYFSMRAFRFLSCMPALYNPSAKNALIVTFGSGIVAGSIAGLPGIEHVDCVEICTEAFKAAAYFAQENHDVLHNPTINFIVNDGRNYVLMTDKRFDIISADATHPTSSDSWILYTKEFYELCSKRLTDAGVMCQWIPLHGVLEKDYRIILNTFHKVFPYAAVYYSGGNKTIGHTVLLGSKSPMKIDFTKAQLLLQDGRVKEDLAEVNVFSVYDMLNCFVLDQDAINSFAGSVPVNTDDKPLIIFSKFELETKPFMGLEPFIKNRTSVYPQLYDIDTSSAALVRQKVESNYEAMGSVLEGQMLEFEEYNLRQKQDFNQSKTGIVRNLNESRALFEQVMAEYNAALQKNPDDVHAKYLMQRTSAEYEYLMKFLEAMGGR
jgi:spermidine synthase